MNILSLIGLGGNKNDLGHIKNLMDIAASDGSFDDIEYDFILEVAKRHKVSTRQVKKLRKGWSHITYHVPDDPNDRFSHLYDLVCLMMIDGNIDKREMKLCEEFAEKLGFEKEKVHELVYSIEQNVAMGHSPEETLMRVKYLVR